MMLNVKNSVCSVFSALLAGSGMLVLSALPVDAGPGGKGHGHGHGHTKSVNAAPGDSGHHMPGGIPGDATKVDRMLLVVAKDSEFNVSKIQVKAGETVRFVVKNEGELVHEFTIGTPEMQKAHQVEMMKMMDAGHLMADKVHGNMDHSHGNSVLVEPGKQGEVIWTFHKGATLEFGCNVPGHYESGMKGSFTVGGAA